MWDREFFTADGREWYEKKAYECREEMTETCTAVMYHTCMDCGQELAPQLLKCVFERSRTYTIKGCTVSWEGWSGWKVIGWKHLKHCIEIPF